jgi:membrane protease YdiL (CAAX protease family)
MSILDVDPWLLFFIATLLTSAPFYFGISNAGGSNDEQFDRRIRQMLWIPGIVALVIRGFSGIGFDDINIGVGDKPWLYAAVFFTPIMLELLLILTVVQFGLSPIDRSLISFKKGKMRISDSIRLVLGSESQSPIYFAINVLATIGIGTLFMIAFSLAEELGWRGFMQVQMMERMSLTSALLLSGLLWGIWYFPLVRMGFRFPEYPRAGAWIFMPVFTISFGIISGWLYWFSNSIWVPALFNAATSVTLLLSTAAFGDEAGSRRVRIVWSWIWAVAAGFVLAIWRISFFS